MLDVRDEARRGGTMRRRREDPKAAALRALGAFAGCDPAELNALARASDVVDAPSDRLLSMEGRVGRDVYVVVEGRAEARREGVLLWEVGPGDIVGELSL